MAETRSTSPSASAAASGAAHRTIDRIAARADETERRLRGSLGRERLQASPFKALGIAFLTGYALCWLARRKRRPEAVR